MKRLFLSSFVALFILISAFTVTAEESTEATQGSGVGASSSGSSSELASDPPSLVEIQGKPNHPLTVKIESPSKNVLEAAAMLKIGDRGDRVREVQATLNEILGGRTLILPKNYSTEKDLKVPKLVLPDKTTKISLSHDWTPSATKSDDGYVHSLELPDEPLNVDGVYGQKTFAAVLLFQDDINLQLTGEVDPTTLEKLEPMVPPKYLLAAIMRWLKKSYPMTLKDEDQTLGDRPLLLKNCTAIIATLLILIVATFVYRFARNLANSTRFLSRWLLTPSNSPWFTTLRQKKVFLLAAQFAPAWFIYFAAAVFPSHDLAETDPFPYLCTFQNWNVVVSRLGLAYVALIAMLVALAFVETCNSVYAARQEDDNNPIEGIILAAKRIVVVIGLILICGALAGKSPVFFVGGMGAFMALIILVFRNSLLGLVASIHIVTNNMVRVGNWIKVPKYSADGEVLAISLSTVKVRNFDNSISTIPTHSLLSESFHNWSSMHETGGRRIKRSLFIDLHSIQVCTPEMIEHFEKIELIGDYVDRKKLELDQYNSERDIEASTVNSRRLTNLGTFRAYLDAYLANHAGLNHEMSCLVRHLQPTKYGLPIEIYVFCSDTTWPNYEAVQADIFEHILAILPEFGLRAFQDANDIDDFAPRMTPHDTMDPATRSLLNEVKQVIRTQNRYLEDHPGASVSVALRKVEKKIRQLGLVDISELAASNRTIALHVQSDASQSSDE